MKIHNPASVFPGSTYSHGIEIPANARWLYVSGQVGVAKDGTPREGIEAQTDQVWQNLKSVLASAGMGMENVVKITTYLVDENHIDGYRKGRAKHLGDFRPASTLVIAKRLAMPGWLVEVEAVAAKA
ncbi:MAG TPA: RidA family protein [Stellaceae bacterium]|nr:RidA family protein [Stellaceae bacterium]